MEKIIGLIILLVITVIVGGIAYADKRRKQQGYFSKAIEYLSKHPKYNFIIHVFTGLGSGWLIALWMPKKLALILGVILVVVAAIVRYVIPPVKLPQPLRSSGMHVGLPVGLGIAWLSYPWIPKILILILGAVSVVGAEIMHYVFPNLVVKK